MCMVSAGMTGISVGDAAGFLREFESKLSGFDFACVCVFCQLCDPHVVSVAGLIFHLREDAGGVLSKYGVECDQRLQYSAPLELVQAPHAVENGREWRLFDWRQIVCFEGLLCSIEDVLGVAPT